MNQLSEIFNYFDNYAKNVKSFFYYKNLKQGRKW